VGYYPLFADVTGRTCLVVGGGAIAEGKVGGLLAAGARVIVVSPTLSPTLAAAASEGRVEHRARPYRDGDLAGVVALAFAATGETAVNAAVAAEGRRRGVWVNAVDDPERCDFIVPAVLRRGTLAVAVSTGGASPALARAVRDDLAKLVGDDYAALADIAADVRRTLRQQRRRVDGRAWRDALGDPAVRRLAAEGRRALARRRLHARLHAASEPLV
jgi:precorrin-2 dehydrogenase/sirohydrochlorin ferrochelatase